MIFFKKTVEGLSLGSSIPTDFEPGIGAIIRTLWAFITRARSSDRFVNLLTRTPSAGSISKSVITGPGDIRTTLPVTPKVSRA